MRVLPTIILSALILTGCATGPPAQRVDQVSFDRAQFAFMLADVRVLIERDCAEKKKSDVDCARMRELYEVVKKQVIAPPPAAPTPSGIDTEQLLKLLGVFVGAAT